MQKASYVFGLKQSIIVFLLSVITLVYWCLGNLINIYQYTIIGALFEILWLPMIAFSSLLPLLSLFFWIKEKWSIKSLYLYSFLLGIPTVLLLFFCQ